MSEVQSSKLAMSKSVLPAPLVYLHLDRTTCPVPTCITQTFRHTQFRHHFIQYHVPVSVFYRCHICNFTDKGFIKAVGHCVKEHGFDDYEAKQVLQSTQKHECNDKYIDPGQYRLNSIAYLYTNSPSEIIHVPPSQTTCPVCDGKSLLSTIKEHWQRCHVPTIVRYICFKCKEKFDLGEDLKRHVVSRHGYELKRLDQESVRNLHYISPGPYRLAIEKPLASSHDEHQYAVALAKSRTFMSVKAPKVVAEDISSGTYSRANLPTATSRAKPSTDFAIATSGAKLSTYSAVRTFGAKLVKDSAVGTSGAKLSTDSAVGTSGANLPTKLAVSTSGATLSTGSAVATTTSGTKLAPTSSRSLISGSLEVSESKVTRSYSSTSHEAECDSETPWHNYNFQYISNTTIECPVTACQKITFPNTIGFRRHFKYTHIPVSGYYVCPICKYVDTGLNKSIKHYMKKHKVTNRRKAEQILISSEWRALNMNFIDPGPYHIKGINLYDSAPERIIYISAAKLSCPVQKCQGLQPKTSLQTHWKTYHQPLVTAYYCCICHQTFVDKMLLKSHLNYVHNFKHPDLFKKALMSHSTKEHYHRNPSYIDPGPFRLKADTLAKVESQLKHPERGKAYTDTVECTEAGTNVIESTKGNVAEDTKNGNRSVISSLISKSTDNSSVTRTTTDNSSVNKTTIDNSSVNKTTTDNGSGTGPTTDNGSVTRTTTDNSSVNKTTTDNGSGTRPTTDNGSVTRTTTDNSSVNKTTTDNGSGTRPTTDNSSISSRITTDNSSVNGATTNNSSLTNTATDNSSVTRTTTDNSSVTRTTTDNSSVTRTTTDNCSLTRTATDNSSVTRTTTDNSSVTRTATDNSSVNRATTNYSSLNKTATDNSSVTRTATDNSSVNGATTNNSSLTKTATDNSSITRTATDNSSITRTTTDNSSMTRTATDNSSMTRTATDNSSMTRTATDNSSMTRTATDNSSMTRTTTDNSSVTRTTTDNSSVTRTATDNSSVTRTTTDNSSLTRTAIGSLNADTKLGSNRNRDIKASSSSTKPILWSKDNCEYLPLNSVKCPVPVCHGKTFADTVALRKHFIYFHIPMVSYYMCLDCDFVDQRFMKCVKHCMVKHNATDEYEVKETLRSSERYVVNMNFIDPGCYHIRGKKDLYGSAPENITYVSPSQWKCPVHQCQKYRLKVSLEYHWKKYHCPVLPEYECYECLKVSFNSKIALSVHLIEQHNSYTEETVLATLEKHVKPTYNRNNWYIDPGNFRLSTNLTDGGNKAQTDAAKLGEKPNKNVTETHLDNKSEKNDHGNSGKANVDNNTENCMSRTDEKTTELVMDESSAVDTSITPHKKVISEEGLEKSAKNVSEVTKNTNSSQHSLRNSMAVWSKTKVEYVADDIVRCPVPACGGQTFTNTTSFRQHFINIHVPISAYYRCPFCNLIDKNVTKVAMHCVDAHNTWNQKAMERRLESSDVHLCNIEFINPGSYHLTGIDGLYNLAPDHIVYVSPPRNRCPVRACAKKLLQMNFCLHWQIYHNPVVEVYTCCCKTFYFARGFRNHLHNEHGYKPEFVENILQTHTCKHYERNRKYIDPGSLRYREVTKVSPVKQQKDHNEGVAKSLVKTEQSQETHSEKDVSKKQTEEELHSSKQESANNSAVIDSSTSKQSTSVDTEAEVHARTKNPTFQKHTEQSPGKVVPSLLTRKLKGAENIYKEQIKYLPSGTTTSCPVTRCSDRQFNNTTNFRCHFIKAHVPMVTYFLCPWCEFVDTKMNRSIRHCMNEHGGEDEFELREMLLENQRIVHNINYVGCSGYRIHGIQDRYECLPAVIKYVSVNESRCPVEACQDSTHQIALLEHWNNIHVPVVQIYNCCACNDTYLGKNNLYTHLQRKHGYSLSEMKHVQIESWLIRNREYRDPGPYRIEK